MFKKLKILLEPIKSLKKWFIIFFLIELYEWVQAVFLIHASSFIIYAIETKNIPSFKFWLTLVIISMVIKMLCSIIDDSISDRMRFLFESHLMEKYLNKYISLDNNKIESFWTWKMNNIIFSWIDNWKVFVWAVISIVIEVFSILYIFILVAIKVPNFYYFLGFLVAFFAIMFMFWKWVSMIRNTRIKNKELYILRDWLKIKVLMSKFEILQNNKIQSEINKLKKIYDQIWLNWWYANIVKNSWQLWSFFILNWFYILIYWVIWFWIISWNYSIAELTLLIWLVQTLSKYCWEIRWYFRDISSYLVDIDKLLETFDNIPEIPGLKNSLEFKHDGWNIRFENMSYWYNKKLVFDNFSLEIKWWKKTAFVGDSWSGKTTLMKLIAGYLHPNSWNIIVNDQNIKDVNLISYYKHIWYLTQDPSVFDWTIIENLAYALDYEPTFEEIEKTIKNSKCEFIYDLQDKLETEIWERWVKLSWGQKQRLAIAKIMLKNPDIILLDEPTSALDSISEQIVSEALHNLFVWKTVIIIAHRLQTVKEADEIIVFKEWKVIEKWDHDNLNNLWWEYKKMLDLQTSF